MALNSIRPALHGAFLLVLAFGTAACEDPVSVGDVVAPTSWAHVSAGTDHTCAIDAGGRAWCWGRAATARLGFLSRVEPCNEIRCDRPVPVVGDLRFEAISAGDKHTCGVSRDTGYCWGWDWWGQLGDVLTAYQRCVEPGGDDELPCSMEPLPIAVGFEIVDVSASVDYSCAVAADGAAYCWGIGHHGQLGVGFAKDSLLSPTAVAGDHDFVEVSTGSSHACGRDTAGEIWCWGANIDGRLGHGDFADSPTPVQVTDDPELDAVLRFADLDVGAIHACGATVRGDAYCWGGGAGRIGDGTDLSWHYPRRVLVPDSKARVVQVSAGGAHSCVLTDEGALYCFGDNTYGQVGDGSTTPQWLPRRISPDVVWSQVSAGARHTCAVDADRNIWCWGAAEFGQLGNGSLSNRTTPVRLESAGGA